MEADIMGGTEDLFEDLSDSKAIEDRMSEPSEDYEAYSRKRKSRLPVSD